MDLLIDNTIPEKFISKTIIENESYYLLENSDKVSPFFMTILSASNHWMFIWSNGALSAGRKNADHALFPYYTDDKIYQYSESCGSKTIIKIVQHNKDYFWEPFSERKQTDFVIQRNLYKSVYGNQIIFEEINHTLEITFQYKWSNSEVYGFLRTSSIKNLSQNIYELELIDGLQNILPYGVGCELQNAYSNLVNAYKSTEIIPNTNIALFALSAIIVDRAEPSEALKANVVWSYGLQNHKILLSDNQLNCFRNNQEIKSENENKGQKGCYFISNQFTLPPNDEKKWFIVANTNQNHTQIIGLKHNLQSNENPIQKVIDDVEAGTEFLIRLIATADGLQKTNDDIKNVRHFFNVAFNSMRGGIFDNNYNINKKDFLNYLKNVNHSLYNEVYKEVDALEEYFNYNQLANLRAYQQADFYRICTEYLPLYFSRRHGDPSRPWNKFSINTQNENDNSKVLDYQGNWRDIFQNWEALAFSFPEFTKSMLFKFLNASTFEGYNPYRITKNGLDWEIIEPDDPWSYIGYWGDHQIIYLLKFLEFLDKSQSTIFTELLQKEVFVYTNIPYRIKPFKDIIKNPKDTITFEAEEDKKLRQRIEEEGSDAVLLRNEDNEIHRVNFIEKILATLVSKMSNYIPEGGIWMNTQRPEWNDANNALVGNGISMVTLYYLRRFLVHFQQILYKTDSKEIKISQEFVDFYKSVRAILEEYESYTHNKISDEKRLEMVEKLGQAASSYRWHIYESGFWGKKRSISVEGILRFVKICLQHIEHSITQNRRDDALYQSYNLAHFHSDKISVSYLSKMLEGQVAVLSSGFLNSNETIQLLESLRDSKLYREDQNSYMLYPNKRLASFLEKNTFSSDKISNIELLKELIDKSNHSIIEKDVTGNYHFNGNFRNANDVENALQKLDKSQFIYATQEQFQLILNLFEEIFNHKEFTGRSGTFYAYEGLGSIYWHMVSKLALAVQENLIQAKENNASSETIDTLSTIYYNIYEGIGIHKSVTKYGAFPTDAYSHTPIHKGVQQPGMTGQVKEDILCRWGELGIEIKNNTIHFNPFFLQKNEFISVAKNFIFYNINGEKSSIAIPENSLAFTYCQVPIIYTLSENENTLTITFDNETTYKENSHILSHEHSTMIFNRSGKIKSILVTFSKDFFNDIS